LVVVVAGKVPAFLHEMSAVVVVVEVEDAFLQKKPIV